MRTTKSGEKSYSAVYECGRHKNLYDYSCPQKSIHKKDLDKSVEEAIRYHIRLFLDTEQVIAELKNYQCRLLKADSGYMGGTLNPCKKYEVRR